MFAKTYYMITLVFLVNIAIVELATPRETAGSSNSRVQEYTRVSSASSAKLGASSSDEIILKSCLENITVDEYILLNNGSVLIPESGKIYEDDSYYRNGSALYLCSEVPVTKSSNEIAYNFSEEFLSCTHIPLEPDEFEILPNRSIHVDIYSRLYDSSNYFLKDERAYVCIPNFSEMEGFDKNATKIVLVKFTGALTYVSYIGISISIISLFCHLVVFCMMPSVRNLPGCCLASLSLCLLLAYLCFISTSLHPGKKHCAGLAVAIYYFFLASFFWMNIVSFDVWRSFRVVIKELRVSSHNIPRRRFCAYSLYCWLIPALLATLAVKADELDLLPDDYRPFFGYYACWFGQRKALLVFFACPLFVIMVLNALFFLDTTYIINRTTVKTRQVNEVVLRKRFFTIVRLALIMGLTWIVGIVAAYVDKTFLWYVFVIMNTLQGLFIFVVFFCSSKVKEFFYRKLGKSKRSRQGTSVRTISQVSAAI